MPQVIRQQSVFHSFRRATQEEAEFGANNKFIMTPLRTQQAISSSLGVRFSHIPHLGYDYSAACNGVTDDILKFESAIADLNTRGGGELYVPGTPLVSRTVVVDDHNITLVGDGSGHHQSSAANIRASAVTRIIYRSVVLGPVWGCPFGCSLRYAAKQFGLRRSDQVRYFLHFCRGIECQSRRWPAKHHDRWQQPSGALSRTAVLATRSFRSTPSLRRDRFRSIYAHALGQVGTTPRGLRLVGGYGNGSASAGNASFNEFITCVFQGNGNHGILLEDTDNNDFYSCTGALSGAMGAGLYGLVLGSADQDSSSAAVKSAARYNRFFGGQYSDVWARAGQSGGASSFDNAFYGYARSNAVPLPTIEAGAGGSEDARIIVHSTRGADRTPVQLRNVGSNQTLTTYDSVFWISAAVSGRIITLPLANAYGAGWTKPIILLRSDANDANEVTLQRAGADTIDGAASIKVSPGEMLILTSDGVSAWRSSRVNGFGSDRQRTVTALSNDGNNTLTAAQFRGGVIEHSGMAADRTDTTPTAALLVAGLPGAVVGANYEVIFANRDDASNLIIGAGTNVTLVGNTTIAPGKVAVGKVVFTNVTAAAEAVTIYLVQPA